jgi:hypothetical protein
MRNEEFTVSHFCCEFSIRLKATNLVENYSMNIPTNLVSIVQVVSEMKNKM